MKRMLVNATQQEELRVAMVDGQKLYDLDIEVPSREQRKANIYKGRITRIEPSLEAAFVDYGAQRHGFLPLKEISPEYFVRQTDGERVQIKDVLRENQEIVVQVDKEERGTKGAALTTYVSLAGRFIVLMPNNPRAGGVSRRITGEDRDVVRQSLEELNLSDDMGCIVRTAGVGRSAEELRWDLDYLLKVWESIKQVVVTRPAPFLIYQEGNAIVRALRDYYSSDIGEILIDDERIYGEAHDFMERVLPDSVRKLKLYDDPTVPLFTRFQIESQIESAFAHKVQLPSGGSIVIDHTEALTAIDINSARSTKGEDIEETALTTNLEAADEVGRQLRIRDLGGLVVVDFIDMGPHRNQREVENRLRDAVKHDRARIQIGRISRFGLLELSRQRLRPSLEESTQSVCPRCNGTGHVRSVESLALAILRLVGEEARKERTAKVIAQLPMEVANYVLNEKRDWVQTIQDRNGVGIVLIGNPDLDTPNYAIRRVRDDEAHLPDNVATSYKLVQPKEDPSLAFEEIKRPVRTEEAAVAGVLPTTPAPQPAAKPPPAPEGKSLWQRMFGWLNSESEEAEEETAATAPSGGSRGTRRPASQDRRQPQGERRSRSGTSRRSRGRAEGERSNRSDRSDRSGESGRSSGRGRSADGKRASDGARGSEGGRSTGTRSAAEGNRAEPGRPEAERAEGERAAPAAAVRTETEQPESASAETARSENDGQQPREAAGGQAGGSQGGSARSRRSRSRRGGRGSGRSSSRRREDAGKEAKTGDDTKAGNGATPEARADAESEPRATQTASESAPGNGAGEAAAGNSAHAAGSGNGRDTRRGSRSEDRERHAGEGRRDTEAGEPGSEAPARERREPAARESTPREAAPSESDPREPSGRSEPAPRSEPGTHSEPAPRSEPGPRSDSAPRESAPHESRAHEPAPAPERRGETPPAQGGAEGRPTDSARTDSASGASPAAAAVPAPSPERASVEQSSAAGNGGAS